MPRAEFFEQYGLFAVKNFLDRDFCAELCALIANAPHKRGGFVRPYSGEEIVDENIKSRKEILEFSKVHQVKVRDKLLSLMPEIEDHYGVELSGVQTAKYSIYETGDFYKTHVDADIREGAADVLTERKISVIVFLNEESQITGAESFSGGNLTFHGLSDNEIFGNFGFPLQSEVGMLITFKPDIFHEVTPVTAGRRFAITTWYI